ncbi:MAG: ATP-dependent 6-phosphofructokinase [Chloroflexota bacterium]
MHLHRVAILTGGGDCPGLNAVIRGFVKAAASHYPWEVVGLADGFDGLLKDQPPVPLDTASVTGLLARGGTILGTSNRSNPFELRTIVNGELIKVDRSAEAVQRLGTFGIDALVVIGGDGSMRIAAGFARRGVQIVGVPKTIDNDLPGTDLTFGFSTAVATATEAIDRLRSTAESHHRIMIVEVMGRDAGWIALEAGLAGGGDILLIPEIPFRVEQVAEHITARDGLGKSFSIIVIAEGAKPVGGGAVYQADATTTSQRRLGGISYWLAERLAAYVPHEVRVTVLGHLQRGGSPNAFDRVLATRFGVAAAHLVGHGSFGQMVALKGDEIVPIPLSEATHGQRLVPPGGERVRVARSLGVSFGD